MSKESAYLLEYQNALQARGIDPKPLALEAEMLEAVPVAQLKHALADFDTSANRITSAWDSDYGALLLETLGDRCADTAKKKTFYAAAAARAAALAAGATAGGEGLARMMDVERIRGKISAQ